MSDPSPAGFDLAEVDRLLSTTRAVRRRLDFSRPVEPEIIHDCIRLSQQSPTGSNVQSWRWLVVDDPAKKLALAEIYARGKEMIDEIRKTADHDDQTRRVYDGAYWLMEHISEVPLFVIPCVQERPPERFVPVRYSTLYGSIMPAIWSFQLALRSRGLGSVFTTIHLLFEDDVNQLFAIPDDVLQVALLPVAHTIGTEFKPAVRPPVESITFWNEWGSGR